MPHYKTSKADLRGKYKRNLKISTIISLIFLIAAFKFSPKKSEPVKIVDSGQEIISIINTEATNQPHIQPKIKPVIPEISIAPETDNLELNTTDLITDAVVEPPPVITDINKTIADENEIFIVVEEIPKPIGGLDAIQSKIHYTDLAMKADIQGKVIVLAVIDKNGNVKDARIAKSLFPQLDEIALNAVKGTKFTPGKQRGRPVNVQMYIPISFKLK